jgi:hypothetical protein
MNIMMLSRFLGWFSLGLGITEAIAPKKLARTLGMSRKAWLIRLFGLREMIAGVTVLAEPDELRGPALRVGGDILDLVVLAPALSPRNRRRGAAHTAFAMVLGVTALDIFCSAALIQNERRRAATAERARLRRSPSAGRLSRQHPATASV